MGVSSLADSLYEGTEKELTYGVIAANKVGASNYNTIDGSKLQAQLPSEVAINARAEIAKKEGSQFGFADSFEKIPTQIPVTMCDGKTVVRPLIIDLNKSVKSQYMEGDVKESTGKVINARTVPSIKVFYKVQGTALTGTLHVKKFDENTYKTDLQAIAKRNLEAREKAGASQIYSYYTKKKDIKDVHVSSTEPDVDYEINATNPITEYLAANMLNGEEYVSVKQFLTEYDVSDIYDAAQEARYQNPYIMDVARFNYIESETVLEIQYNIGRTLQEQQQKEVEEQAQKIVAEVTKAGMSDLEKATALNDYLCKNAEYDYVALEYIDSFFGLNDTKKYPYAWSPYGVLVKKKGVCMSYADAFKILADEAQLTCVTVSGIVNGKGHAWNKVKIDNKWRVVDVTWNDSNNPNQYFNLKDQDSKLKGRQQNNEFIFDPFVSNYNTN